MHIPFLAGLRPVSTKPGHSVWPFEEHLHWSCQPRQRAGTFKGHGGTSLCFENSHHPLVSIFPGLRNMGLRTDHPKGETEG